MEQVFNELSADGKYPTHQDANDAVRKLLDLSKNMTAIGFSRELRVSSNFCSLELCKGLTLGRWLNEHIKEDSGRLLLSYASKMPYVDDVLRDEGKHFTYRGNDAYGLGYAYLRGTVALALECFPEGDTELDSDIGKVSVMTISTCRKFTDGKKHLRQKIFSEIKDGSGLIEKFAVLFPYIRLSKDARKNIASLNGNEDFFRKYINHFVALNEAAITGSIEVLSSEGINWSEETGITLQKFKKERTFLCSDGRYRLFSKHTKMLRENQRIYFLLENNLVYIGYAGEHLSTVQHKQ